MVSTEYYTVDNKKTQLLEQAVRNYKQKTDTKAEIDFFVIAEKIHSYSYFSYNEMNVYNKNLINYYPFKKHVE